MTGTVLTRGNYKRSHRYFGGVIYESDFSTEYPGYDCPNGSYIASRIFSDHRFDERCKRNDEKRNQKSSYNAKQKMNKRGENKIYA